MAVEMGRGGTDGVWRWRAVVNKFGSLPAYILGFPGAGGLDARTRKSISRYR